MSSLVSIAYDANQHFFAGLNSIQRGNSFGHRSIQERSAFDGRATCIIQLTALFWLKQFPRPYSSTSTTTSTRTRIWLPSLRTFACGIGNLGLAQRRVEARKGIDLKQSELLACLISLRLGVFDFADRSATVDHPHEQPKK
jgi:hypothetical protein